MPARKPKSHSIMKARLRVLGINPASVRRNVELRRGPSIPKIYPHLSGRVASHYRRGEPSIRRERPNEPGYPGKIISITQPIRRQHSKSLARRAGGRASEPAVVSYGSSAARRSKAKAAKVGGTRGTKPRREQKKKKKK